MRMRRPRRTWLAQTSATSARCSLASSRRRLTASAFRPPMAKLMHEAPRQGEHGKLVVSNAGSSAA
eukprot:8218228-Alexandrium_andersonii.AAC.1